MPRVSLMHLSLFFRPAQSWAVGPTLLISLFIAAASSAVTGTESCLSRASGEAFHSEMMPSSLSPTQDSLSRFLFISDVDRHTVYAVLEKFLGAVTVVDVLIPNL